LSVDPEAFTRHLAEKFADTPPETALETRHVEDLYLAFACGHQDSVALEKFASAYYQDVEVACVRTKGAPSPGEIRQQLSHKLFVAGAGLAPRILEYSGQGTLRGWFRVIVSRAILDQLRVGAREGGQSLDEDALGIPSPNDDPETQYLKRRYGHEFRESFEKAVLALEPEERNVLRSYYAKRLSIDQIASMFGIHRATAARRVNRARETLMAETRRHLTERLKLSGTELESVLRLIESQIHVSVERLLG
jgi:RNA polymerase sigma-70 factor (ECF subfamily)